MGSRFGLAPMGLAFALAATALGTGCSDSGTPPVIDAVADQSAVVGQELVINLRASDPDGDNLTYAFEAPVEGIDEDASIRQRPDGTAVFRWTPLAADVGSWFFDFKVSDDDGEDRVTVVIDVVATSGAGSAPIIREPLSSGTTLDLAQAACLDLPIVVEDADDPEVGIDVMPELEGAELLQDTGLTAQWRWCPSKAQLEEDRYPVVIAADDGKNEPVLKNYLVVLRAAPKQDCPGEAPHVGHVPRNVETMLDLEIEAEIMDDSGLKRAPLLYFTYEEPKLPIDFGTLDVLEMELADGDMQEGTWRGVVPNPVATAPEGTAADIFYVISVTDNDDADGDCDHLVDSPAEGTYRMTVTRTGETEEGAGACEPCSADVQCGNASDLCVTLDGDDRCTTSCEDDCGDGEICVEVTSVDGEVAMQCAPEAGSCEPQMPECEDDAHEDDDDATQADDADPLPVDMEFEGKSCSADGMDDEDWFLVELDADAQIHVTLEGGGATDLNLALLDDQGETLAQAESGNSNESIEMCLTAGTHYVRVYTFEDGENDYALRYTLDAEACAATCEDDDLEQDDSPAQATYAEVFPDGYSINGRQICSEDDDYYRVELYTGETLIVDLTFDQETAGEDLDLHFLDSDQTDLTPCTEAEPSTCSIAQGQSVTSNEHYEYEVTAGGCAPCEFWVQVHGWDGAENEYSLSLELE